MYEDLTILKSGSFEQCSRRLQTVSEIVKGTDIYRFLGVSNKASAEEIKENCAKIRTLIKDFKQRFGIYNNPHARLDFKYDKRQLNTLIDILSEFDDRLSLVEEFEKDPTLRLEYDTKLAERRAQLATEAKSKEDKVNPEKTAPTPRP